MKVTKTTDIKEEPLEKVPTYYKSAAGNPRRDRLDKGMEAGTPILPIAKILEFDFEVALDSSSNAKVVEHDLGFAPQVIGIYYFESLGDRRILGDVIDPTFARQGYVWVDDINTRTVTVGAVSDGGGTDTLNMKLYLLDLAL